MATQREPNHNPDLPEQILCEILLRLPVKTLSRYKSVCKSWLSLISSSYFIKTHSSISTNDPHLTHHYFLPRSRKREYLECYSVYSMLNKPATEAIKIDSPIKNESRGFAKIVGCNGLVCLHIEKSSARCTEPVGLFFWNPFTRKIRRLPELIIEPEKFGLGYEESSDDFKLFVIAAGHGDYEKKVSVYCSKSNSWKGNGDFPSGIVLDNGIFADGAVHWVTQRMNMESQTIVSVDVKNQTLRDLVLPTTNGGCLDYWITLGSFGKSLSVVHSLLHGYSSHECDIWMLNKCDAKESWTKVFTFPVNGLPVCCPDLTPLCICVNGDILLRSGTNLWLYNSKDNTLNVLSHKKFDENYVYSSTCVESLFSP